MSNTQPGAASTTPKKRRASPTPPVSATVAKLMAQIQAEAEAATLAALSAKDGILVLQPLDEATRRARFDGDTLRILDGTGGSIRAYRHRTIPEGWSPDGWHPSHYTVHVTRLDGTGQSWSAYIGAHVTDDFGNLVAVPA